MMCLKILKNTTWDNTEVKITPDQIHAFNFPHHFDNSRFFAWYNKTHKKQRM